MKCEFLVVDSVSVPVVFDFVRLKVTEKKTCYESSYPILYAANFTSADKFGFFQPIGGIPKCAELVMYVETMSISDKPSGSTTRQKNTSIQKGITDECRYKQNLTFLSTYDERAMTDTLK